MRVLDAGRHRGASFTLANRLARVGWRLGWLLLARWTPPPFHPWRRLVLRLFGATVGAGARVHASVRLWYPPHLTLGAGVLIGPGAELYNQGHITVGAGTTVSQRAFLCASSHDLADPHFQLVLRPITVGAGCWIAAEAFIGPGVRVGDRAVVAARAALFEDAEPGQVYRGNPAVRVRARDRG